VIIAVTLNDGTQRAHWRPVRSRRFRVLWRLSCVSFHLVFSTKKCRSRRRKGRAKVNFVRARVERLQAAVNERALDMDPPQMLDAALLYAARGWPVFPCHPQTKRPLLKPDIDRATGAEIPNTGGLKKASTDPEPIRGWWKRWPKAMIGVPTGSPISAFVVDFDAGIDGKTGQVFEVSKLIRALCLELDAALPETWTAETPRGGRHLYFKLPEGSPPGNRVGLIGRVDIRGDGGYVIVPPSVRSDGKFYRWITAPW
jgi:hypothetical protein